MNSLNFTKMVGAGNDFIVADNRKGLLHRNLNTLAARLTNRRLSVGADGMLLLEKSNKANIKMRIFNPDGSEAEMCGNGIRCLAKFAFDKKIIGPFCKIETLAGLIETSICGKNVRVKMLDPKDLKLDLAIKIFNENIKLHYVNTGVPHAVILLRSLDNYDIEKKGALIRFHSCFKPKGANVNFVSQHSAHSIRIRTYERGVEAETLSCGTGSTAAAIVMAALKELASPIHVYTKSGDKLNIYFSKEGLRFYNVYLEGSVQTAFEGRIGL